ncbi:uncharacterized protein VICG_01212 [Vittaforma corneae ATCC 50505]|uniref:Uncharacterized protein n=1 Tax=Vittaforma corneae (strain ATCC 50505) TaxID=993615 RepID=L2GLE9_VITCO|nr:uncharacterized protein VICG_01212 [Vittaforma corneae ATCC 50505]ELA41708.1 hypothetical protein VICG_01212 [Vittaforma corneae ATCC 50505]
MHGLSLPIKTVTGLIEVLSVGFPMLFSADASCTVMSKEQGSLEEQVQSIHISDDESDDTLPNETPKLSVFKDKDDGCFTAFMKDSRIIKIIEEYFKNLNHIQREEYEKNINEINEIVGMKLYNYCTETMSGCLSKDEILNEDGSLKEKIAQQAEGYFEISFKEWESKFKRIEVSGFEFDHIPTKALKFLTEYLETDELSISETLLTLLH